ncbi:PC-esterase domain-containing protein 1A-like isoform X2 [Centruroides sculpturatus]|uniref:PC-esterase domain-containing protein 1A-like isoform X2 n=1 Tax=Centruroides sculpturatus TaxID=218467 RepID=UPI000C6E7AAC|nr:PC-esterase domain-containing protein 1A-like isoform X2 [Centruroides sculpturatus]
MAIPLPEIFLNSDLDRLFSNKRVILLGDSNVRAIYKDLVALSQDNLFSTESGLKAKMEDSFMGDKLIYCDKLTIERIYKEERLYQFNDYEIRFFFITRVYDDYMENILKILQRNTVDIVLINSCLWDITRWGPKGVENYKINLQIIARKFREILPEDCLVIWLTTLPISQDVKGGFLVPELEFLKFSLRFHVMEANIYARKVFNKYGLDILDLHYRLQMHIHQRKKDGIHWEAKAVRHMTNSILTHISLAWNVKLPSIFNKHVNIKDERNLEEKDNKKNTIEYNIISKYKIDRRKIPDNN